MKSRFLSSLLLSLSLATVYVLVACQPTVKSSDRSFSRPGHSSGTPDVSNPGSPTPPSSRGTTDRGGGGNLIDGQPLENFLFDVTQRPEYKEFIEPLEAHLSRFMDENGSGGPRAYFRELALSKNWYLVPVPLDQIPKASLGVGFATIQGAYQTEKAVFLTALEFNSEKMTSENRGKLLFHELIMALYRVQFEPIDFYCRVYVDVQVRNSCLNSASSTSLKNPLLKPRYQEEFLKASDYEPIRSATQWLWENLGKINRSQWMEFMVSKNFDPRFFRKDSFEMDKKQTPPPFSTEEFQRQVEVLQKTQKWPTHCDFNEENPAIAKDICQVEISFTADSLTLKVTPQKIGKTETYTLPLSLSEKHEVRWDEGVVAVRSGLRLRSIQFTGDVSFNKPTEDFQNIHIDFLFIDQSKPPSLYAIKISKWMHIAQTPKNKYGASWIGGKIPHNAKDPFTSFISISPELPGYFLEFDN